WEPGFFERRGDILHRSPIEDRCCELASELLACPPEQRFIDLPQVHTRRHTQRVEHDIDRRSIFEERHVLDRDDPRHDTLVAVTARHLVANLDLALTRDIDLGELYDAWREFVAHLHLVLQPFGLT